MTLILPITLPSHGEAKNSTISNQLYQIQTYLNSGGVALVGTTTNDNAAAGDIGEYAESIVASGSAVSSTGSGQLFDVASILLTAGDWAVTGLLGYVANGATITFCDIGISATSGNSSTGLSYGNNRLESLAVPTAVGDASLTLPMYRISLASSVTYYLKAAMAYTVATPKSYGRISAWRMR